MCVDVNSLPFVEVKDGRLLSLWNVKESGVYASDTKTGRDHADAFVALVRRRENPTLLGKIVKSMVQQSVYGPVETGFFHRLMEYGLSAERSAGIIQVD
jgi:hypothetical protein